VAEPVIEPFTIESVPAYVPTNDTLDSPPIHICHIGGLPLKTGTLESGDWGAATPHFFASE